MAYNALWGYVSSHIKSYKGAATIERTKGGAPGKPAVPYVIIKLPMTRKVVTDKTQQYTLTDHHLSIYKKKDETNSVLSQYHYTGYFQDGKGNQYQAHVYFNSKDQLACKPQFSKFNGKDYVPLNDNPELSNQLTHLGTEMTRELMIQLRAGHKTQLDAYSKKLEEQVALLPAHTADPTQYKKSIDDIIETLTQLKTLGEKTCKNLMKYYASLVPPTTQTPTPSQPHLAIPEQTPTPASSTHGESTPLIPKKKHGSQKQLQELIGLAKKSRDALIASRANKDPTPASEQITNLLELHRTLSDALLGAHDKQYLTHPTDLRDLYLLEKERNDHAIRLITNRLVAKDFEQANRLASFAKLMPNSAVSFALRMNNHKALDFLLSNGDFPLNTMTVEQGLTPVLYCYTQDENGNKAECLAVLIQHGASIMVKHEGLAIAQRIYADARNPLFLALIKTDAITLTNKQFYIEMNNIINELSTHPDSNDIFRRNLHDLLVINNDGLRDLASAGGKKMIDLLYQSRFRDRTTPFLIRSKDREDMSRETSIAISTYLATLPKAQSGRMHGIFSHYFVNQSKITNILTSPEASQDQKSKATAMRNKTYELINIFTDTKSGYDTLDHHIAFRRYLSYKTQIAELEKQSDVRSRSQNAGRLANLKKITQLFDAHIQNVCDFSPADMQLTSTRGP